MPSVARHALLAALLFAPSLHAATQLPAMQVTATREPEPIEKLAASMSVVTGEELRARGVNDLRTALALVAGVEGTPGGDGGPGGSVPSLWGLREVDAFLLVIDGVPAGGAFNPATVTVDMTGVERIEVLRGAAPVMYGATSFNGVIHIIHYAAGKAPATVGAGIGSESSYAASYFGTLSDGDFKQSVTANVEKRGYRVQDQENSRLHLLYRAARGGFHADLDLSSVPQTPGGTTFRNGGNLRTDLVPNDANQNPSDAKIDQTRAQLNLGYAEGRTSTTLSFTHTKDEIVRGFHEANSSTRAHGYEQEREITDVYFDTHLRLDFGALGLTWGVDYLFGQGKQEAFRFPYLASNDGSLRQSSASAMASCVAIFAEECVDLESEVERNFAGAYVQGEWAVTPSLQLIGGLRLNQTEDKQEGEDEGTGLAKSQTRTTTRGSGVIGGTWQAWREGNSNFAVYADYRNTFKPIAAELGPEAGVDILNPETAESYEFGLRGAAHDGRLQWDASVFRLDFKNQKTLDTSGNAVNAGETRFQGGELEFRYAVLDALTAMGSYAYHDSRFVHFNRDGTPGGVVDGNRFELAPYNQEAVGLVYAPAQGFTGSFVASHVGQRMLNKSNTLQQPGFVTIDASVGWNFGGPSLTVNAYNLGDARDVVAESEQSGEVAGASSYYLMQGRRLMLNFAMPL